MSKTLKVLVIEDSEADALLLLAHLRKGGYDPLFRRVDNAADLADAMARQKWDIAFSDHNMPAFSSTAALEIVRACDSDLPFLIVSGSIGEEVAVASMKAGAQDYLMKGNLTRLVDAVDRELKEAEDRRARREAERALLVREEELRIARDVQQQLFPTTVPSAPGYDIGGASRPAEATGGDYYDFIACPGGDLYVVVGDVTGHGLGPALLMTDVRAYLRALVLSNLSLEALLAQTRHLLLEDLGNERFVTMLIARLTPATGLLEVINAGHPSGYIVSPDGATLAELGATAPALGIAAETETLVSRRLTLGPGESAIFLTDGLIEALSPEDEEFGIDRIIGLLRSNPGASSAAMIGALFEDVDRFVAGEGLHDDITALIIRRLPAP